MRAADFFFCPFHGLPARLSPPTARRLFVFFLQTPRSLLIQYIGLGKVFFFFLNIHLACFSSACSHVTSDFICDGEEKRLAQLSGGVEKLVIIQARGTALKSQRRSDESAFVIAHCIMY